MKHQWFKKNYIMIAALIMIMLSLGINMYNNLSREGIYLKVLDRNGYEIYTIRDEVNFLAIVKPEWIPQTADDKKIIKKKVADVEGVEVFLDNVIHRGHDIYFSFTVQPQIKLKEGKFLSTREFDENGTVTQGMPKEIYLYNDKQDIEYGQWGLGPLDMVSFGVDVDDFEKIRNGFNFEYSGFKLYGYQKK